MAFAAVRKGSFEGTRADRAALAINPASANQAVSIVYNGSHVKHTFWDLLANGDIFETPVDSKSGGMELAIAAYSDKRVVSMHRKQGKLKFEAWETGGFFTLNDDHLWINDSDPNILTFGAKPPSMPSTAQPPGTGSQQPGPAPGTGQPAGPVKPVGGVQGSFGPKAGRALVVSKLANHLHLSLWMFDNGGEVQLNVVPHADLQSVIATNVSAAKLKEIWPEDNKHVRGLEAVTAIRGSGNVLQLHRWRVMLGQDGNPAEFNLLGQATAPEVISDVKAVTVPALSGMQIATPVMLADGTLKVIAWKMETNGGITRLSEAMGGGIDSLTATHARSRIFVTAVRESDKRFKASYWRFPNSASGALEHLGDAVEGKIGGCFDCVHFPGSASSQLGDTLFAAKTEGGKLQLWRYRITV